MPRLPRKTKVDVTKCHACHVKRRRMSPSATPATQSAAASPATNPVQAGHQSQPRKTKVDVSKCNTCHVKRRRMSPSATPDTPRNVPRRHRQLIQPKRATIASPVPSVPCLPRKTKVDVSKCHACHVKRRRMLPNATPATQSAAASPATNPAQARRQSQPSAISATPATQNEGGCDQMPRLPRETKADVPSATPATQSAAASPATNPVQARHQSQPSALSATHATQNESECHQVPRLPREMKADVAKCDACATPAT